MWCVEGVEKNSSQLYFDSHGVQGLSEYFSLGKFDLLHAYVYTQYIEAMSIAEVLPTT